MKSLIIALTCALAATACGPTNGKSPENTPSSYNAPAPSNNGSATVTSATNQAALKKSETPEQAKDVDNTKVNERDRGGSTLTPMEQGNSGSETKISAAIRRGLTEDNNLSFTAKNVKIITLGTKVTLRGPVNSKQERAAVVALAKQTAGVSEVDDQLEIKK